MAAQAVSIRRNWERRKAWGLMDRLLVIGFSLGYLALLHLIYVDQIAPFWRSYGFYYYAPEAVPLILAWVLALVPSTFMPRHLERPSMLIYWAMYLLVYIPVAIMPLYVRVLPAPRALMLPLMLLPQLVLIRLAYLIPVVKLPQVRVPEWLGIGIPLALCLGTAAATARNITLSSFSLTLVYTIREQWASHLSGLMSYFFIWQANVVGPLLVVIGLSKRRPWLAAAGLLSSVGLFATSGLKSALFSPIGAAAIWWGVSKLRRPRALHMLLWLVAGLTVTYFVDGLIMEPQFGRPAISSMLTRRITYVPGILTGHYVDFFSNHPPTLFTESRLFAWAGDYPYDQPLGKLMGYQYSGNPDQNAVANLWADGYAGMGWVGMYFITLQFIAVLLATDSVSRGHPLSGVAGLLVTPIFSLTNTALSVALLTWGLGPTLLMLYLLPRTTFRSGPARRWVVALPRPRGRARPARRMPRPTKGRSETELGSS